LLDDVALTAPQNQRIVIKDGSKIKIIPVQDIFYLEAADDFVKVFTKEGYFLKNKTMSHFEQVLDPSQFVRSHRSYIVNLQQITRIDPYEKDNHVAILRSGAKVPVSRTGYPKLKAILGL
jgi:two-component system LytT family response regulator